MHERQTISTNEYYSKTCNLQNTQDGGKWKPAKSCGLAFFARIAGQQGYLISSHIWYDRIPSFTQSIRIFDFATWARCWQERSTKLEEVQDGMRD